MAREGEGKRKKEKKMQKESCCHGSLGTGNKGGRRSGKGGKKRKKKERKNKKKERKRKGKKFHLTKVFLQLLQ